MLMGRARAHSSSCSQVILVYVHPFCLGSLFCSRKSQKFTKTPYFGVEGHSRLLMLIALKSTLPALVMISNTSVPICKRFHARQANSEKITTFKEIPLTPAYAGLVERRRMGPRSLKPTFNGKKFHMHFICLSPGRHFGAIHS